MNQILAFGMPGPIELVVLFVFAAFGLAFVFLLFRFLWRAGSPKV